MVKVPSYIEALTPYQAGKAIQKLGEIKLASNENPLGPSPKAIAAIQLSLSNLHRYPGSGEDLKAALAQKFQVSPDNIILGGGSDSLMLSVVRAFVTEGGEVVTSEGSFPQFFLMPQSRGAFVKQAPLKNYAYDLEAVLKLIGAKTQVIFLSNPNNPTGTFFSTREWELFCEAVPKEILIVLDEAYAEFAERCSDFPGGISKRPDNVLTLRTFSKAYGLAGLRLGYGVGANSLIQILNKVKLPFEPSSLALVAGLAALQDEDFLAETRSLVREGKEFLEGELKKMEIRFVPSAANFIFIELENAAAAEKIYRKLIEEGVIIRPLGAFGFSKAFRVSIGKREENKKFVEILRREYVENKRL